MILDNVDWSDTDEEQHRHASGGEARIFKCKLKTEDNSKRFVACRMIKIEEYNTVEAMRKVMSSCQATLDLTLKH